MTTTDDLQPASGPVPFGGEPPYALPAGSESQSVFAGTPQDNLIAAVMQTPPGEHGPEDDETGAYSLSEILPVLRRSYLDLMEAREDYDRAEKYFHGISPEVFSDPQLRRLLGLSDDVYALNYASIPVTCRANRMSIHAIVCPGDDAATADIADLWLTNRLPVEEHGFTVDALKYGDNYMIIWPREDGSVQMAPNNPMTTRLFYDPEDNRTKTHAIKAWQVTKKVLRTDLYFPGYVYKFISNNQGKVWDMFPEPDGTWPMVNPYGQVPVFHWRAGDSVPYGTPMHANAYGPQDGLTKAATTLFATIDFLGFPQRYALIEAAEASGTAEFSDFDTDQPDSFITDDAGRTSGLRQGPGELWTLRAKAVGQFQPAPADGFITTWNQCVGAMSAATSTPMRFFTDPGGQHPTGDSLRASDLPLKQSIKTLSLAFASAWAEAFTFALAVAGVVTDRVVVQWAIDGPTDDNDAVSGVPMAVWKLRAGVPVRQVYRDMGYTDDQINAWGLRPEDELATPPQLWPFSARNATAEEVSETQLQPGQTPGINTPDSPADPTQQAGNAPPPTKPVAPSASPAPPPTPRQMPPTRTQS